MLGAQEQKSEVARVLAEIRKEYEAGQRAIAEIAYGTGENGFIAKKMDRLQSLHGELRELVGDAAIPMIAAELKDCYPRKQETQEKTNEDIVAQLGQEIGQHVEDIKQAKVHLPAESEELHDLIRLRIHASVTCMKQLAQLIGQERAVRILVEHYGQLPVEGGNSNDASQNTGNS